MNQLHKLFKELQKLDYEDFDLLCDAWREYNVVKKNCENMGIKYSDKYLKNAVATRRNNVVGTTIPTPVVNIGLSTARKKIEQIILGDNLDMIEEAAKKKGLL